MDGPGALWAGLGGMLLVEKGQGGWVELWSETPVLSGGHLGARNCPSHCQGFWSAAES